MRWSTFQATFSVANADQEIASSNPNRRTITISAPSVGFLLVNFKGATTTTVGFPIQAGQAPVIFDYDQIGDAICNDVHAQLSVAGPAMIGVIERIELP